MASRYDTLTHVVDLKTVIDLYVKDLELKHPGIVRKFTPKTFVDQTQGKLIVHVICEIDDTVPR